MTTFYNLSLSLLSSTHLHIYPLRYKHTLFLEAKRRQATKVRRMQGSAQRRDGLEGEVSTARRAVSEARAVIESLDTKQGELEQHLEELTSDTQNGTRKQLRECETKLAWLRTHFPAEYEMSDLAEEDTHARRLYEGERSALQAERLSLRQHPQQPQESEANLRHQSTEIRCRRSAEDIWRKELMERWTLTKADILALCRELREGEGASVNSEGGLERQIEAIGSAEVVEAWVREAHPNDAKADIRDSFEAFIDAFAAETDELAAQHSTARRSGREANQQSQCIHTTHLFSLPHSSPPQTTSTASTKHSLPSSAVRKHAHMLQRHNTAHFFPKPNGM